MGGNRAFSSLPSLSSILSDKSVAPLIGKYGKETVKLAARVLLEELRAKLEKEKVQPDRERLLAEVLGELPSRLESLMKPGPRWVINATGIVIHTNLGRAPLPKKAVEHLVEVASRYSDLEFDLETGSRGSRGVHVEALLREIFGAEGAFVVNNNASAVLLVLAALARGREVVISRGELVEIGGSFRIPEIMAESGAVLVEVGTTNKTRVGDYERAFSDATALFLKVHRSNFSIKGFTDEVSLDELSALGKKFNVPVVYDMGSGSVFDMSKFGFSGEEGVRKALLQGADLVTFSGDKLLGGSQAGIVVGRRDLIDVLKAHPLARVLRIDKLNLAALASLLTLYRDEKIAIREIPVLKMLLADERMLKKRARWIAKKLKGKVGSFDVHVVEDRAECGGGALPGVVLPTWCVALRPVGKGLLEVARAFRDGNPPLIGRIKEGSFLIDLRTVFPEEDRIVVERAVEVDVRLG